MTDRLSHGWVAFIAIAAGLVLMLTGCRATGGSETAPLNRALGKAVVATETARGDAKEVKRILSRVDFKAGRILELLGK